MNKENINFRNDYLIILSLIIFSLLISLSYHYLQYGIDGGLVLANQIKYPDNNSPMLYYFLNSWTLIHQISFILIKIGLSVEIISKMFIFISTISFTFGVLLFSYSITKIKSLSFLISITAILLGKNFGDTDYPSLIFSEHTYGMISLAIFTLILGLIANKNFLFASIFLVVSIAIHPLVGAWTIIISFISFYFLRNFEVNRKELLTGSILGFILILISFIFFYYNSIEKIDFDSDLFQIYLNDWDGHRVVSQKIHSLYLLKTFVLTIFCFIFFKNNSLENKTFNSHILILLISLILSSLLYLYFKFLPNYIPEFIKIIMPSRFIMLHTFLGWPLIISFIFLFFQNKYKKEKVIKIFSIFLILIILQNHKKILALSDNFIENFETHELSKVIEYVKNDDFNGYILTSSNLTSFIFKKTKKPILLHTDSMDFIPYHPYLVNNFFYILQNLYNIKNFLPPEANNPSLPDYYIKTNFEKYTQEDWIKKQSMFNLRLIIVPSDWNLNLDLIMEDKFFKLYKIL